MLRFFRTIRKKLIEEDNVRKYLLYAIGEILLVVIGILIALQVNNWNEDRKERALELEYLQRLYNDIQLSVQRAESNIISHERQIASQSVIINVLNSCTLDDKVYSDFTYGIFRIGQFEAPTLVHGVIDELHSTGRISLIRNIELRSALTEVLDEHNRRSEILGFIIDRATPQISYIDSRSVINIPGDGTFVLSDFSPDMITFDLIALCNDPRYISAVSTIRFTTNVTLGHHKQMLIHYQSLLEMLDNELEKKINYK